MRKRTGLTVSSRCMRVVCALAIAVILAGSGCASNRFRPPKHVKPIQRDMEVTGYNKCRQCCNWKRNWRGKAVIASGPNKGQPKQVGITASGTKARVGTIAADTDLYPFGTIMYVPGYGYGRVEDRGSAIKGQSIDLYFSSYKQALAWGRQTRRVVIWLPSGY